MKLLLNRGTSRERQWFFLGPCWEGDIWVDCEGWKDGLQQDSHPLKALVFPSVEQFSSKPERRKKK